MDRKRPSFREIYMGLALSLARRSTCLRLQVGTVIMSPDYRKGISSGYNGNTTGEPNRCDLEGAAAVGNCGCLHSEENAIINCDVPRATQKVVFVTHLPCKMCAKRLINLGNVLQVYFNTDYRNHDGLELLQRAGIKIDQYLMPETAPMERVGA